MHDDQPRHSLTELPSESVPLVSEGAAEPSPPPSPPGEQPPSPPEPGAPEDIRTWQRQLVQGVLRILTIVGALALVVVSYNDAYVEKELGLIPFYVGAYAVLLVITFWRRVPYGVQAGTLLGLIYGLAVLGLFEAGLSGDGRVFLLTLPPLAVIFFGRREGIFALAVTMLTLVAFAWAFSTGRIVIPVEDLANSDDAAAWLSGGVVFFMLGTLLLTSQNYLIPRLASALTQSRQLARELAGHRAELEERVAERTLALQNANYALQRRAMQLEASAEIGRAITSVFDIHELLRKTVNLIRERFGFYHAGIFLLDESGEWAVLQEATGEAGFQMKAQGHRLEVAESSMVGWTALHGQPRIALDVGEDAVHFVNPLLPHTRSEMTLPLMVGGKVLGVLDIQSTAEAAFDEEDARVLQNMADQIAIALENARRISHETALLETASPIYRVSRRLTTAMTEKEVADAIIEAVAETGADSCSVGIFEPPDSDSPETVYFVNSWRRDRTSLVSPGARVPLSASHVPLHALNNLWVVPDVTQAPDLTEEQVAFVLKTGMRAMVIVPLRVRGRLMGFLAISRVAPGPFTESALRLYEVLSDQAAVALERALLLARTRQQAERERLRAEIVNRLRASTEVDTILQTAIRELGRALQTTEGMIYLGVDGVEPVTASSAEEKAEG